MKAIVDKLAEDCASRDHDSAKEGGGNPDGTRLRLRSEGAGDQHADHRIRGAIKRGTGELAGEADPLRGYRPAGVRHGRRPVRQPQHPRPFATGS
jgi:hypothetical protein